MDASNIVYNEAINKVKQKEIISKYTLIFIFLMIFINDDVLIFRTNENSILINLKYFFIAFSSLSGMVLYTTKHYIRGRGTVTTKFLVTTLLLIFLFLSMLNNSDLTAGYMNKAMAIVLGFVITEFVSLKIFAKGYVKVMYLLCLVSLIVYTLYTINPVFFNLVPTIYNQTGLAYKNLLLSIVPHNHYGILRNYGIFREPSIYQMYISMAMIFEIFINDKCRTKYLLVFLASIITTFSTTGYILLFIIMFFYLFKKNVSKKQRLLIFIVSSLILGFMFFYTDVLFSDKYYSILGKIFYKGESDSSFSSRFYSIFANMKIIKDYPFFGVGISSVDNIFFTTMVALIGNGAHHNTNTLLIQATAFGVPFALVYVYSVYKFSKRIISGKGYLLIMILFFIIMLSTGLVLYSLLFNTLWLYGYKNAFQSKK